MGRSPIFHIQFRIAVALIDIEGTAWGNPIKAATTIAISYPLFSIAD